MWNDDLLAASKPCQKEAFEQPVTGKTMQMTCVTGSTVPINNHSKMSPSKGQLWTRVIHCLLQSQPDCYQNGLRGLATEHLLPHPIWELHPMDPPEPSCTPLHSCVIKSPADCSFWIGCDITCWVAVTRNVFSRRWTFKSDGLSHFACAVSKMSIMETQCNPHGQMAIALDHLQMVLKLAKGGPMLCQKCCMEIAPTEPCFAQHWTS